MIKIGILGSGRGSNCRAILQSIRDGKLNAKATVVISDVLDAPILEIAREFGVANAYLPSGHFRTRLEPKVEAQLVKMLQDAEVEVVVLAGFMRVLKEQMLAAFPRRIVNIHPSLLPKFPAQRKVPVMTDDTPELLHARIQEVEHVLYPEALEQVFRDLRCS